MFRTKSSFKSLLIAALVGLFAAGRAGAAAAPAKDSPPSNPPSGSIDLFGDTLVAKGKDVAVKRSDLDEAMVNIKSAAAASQQTISRPEMDVLEQRMLDRLIQIQLLLAKATDADKAAGKEVTDKRLASIKEQARNEAELNRQLKAMGTSQDKLRTKMTEEATALTVVQRELKVSVKDDEVKKYYDEHPAAFEQPERVRVSHILFATKDLQTGADLSTATKTTKKQQAEAVLKRARAGEDFAKLVKEFSDDVMSKDRAGEFIFGRASASPDPSRAMPPEFENAAFSLKPNGISDIVTTQFGYEIIKLNEKIPAKKLEFAKVSQDIREYLTQEQLKTHQQEYQALVDKLKKDADVTVLDDRLKLKSVPEPTGPAAGDPALKR